MNRLIIFLFVIAFSAHSYAQDYTTTTIAGKEYYLYKVKKSEGLYRISLNFGVSKEEILKVNPQIEQGLKLGEEILIPKKKGYPKDNIQSTQSRQNSVSSKSSTADKSKSNVASSSSTSNRGTVNSSKSGENEPHFYYHKVKKQETLFGLSKQYQVKQEDIIAQNPSIAKGLREGEVIRIPKAEDIYTQIKEEKAKEDFSVKYLIHKVKAKETLFSISRRYEVKIEDIMKINPEMQTLQIDQELRIPFYQGLETAKKTVKGEEQEKEHFDWENIFGKKPKDKIQIAFLLPFDIENQKKKNNDRFVDFYAGAVKAIHEAEQAQKGLDIYTYDTGKSRHSFENLLALNPNLKNMDLIIGPAYSDQVSTASEFAQSNRIQLVVPFTSKIEEINKNPYLLQFNAGEDSELEFFKSLFETKLKGMNYIFLTNENSTRNNIAEKRNRELKKYLSEQELPYKEMDIALLHEQASDSVFTHHSRNIIFFNSDKFSEVSPYFDNLNIKNRRYEIILFEEYNWSKNSNPRPQGLYIAAFKPEHEIRELEKYDQSFFNLFSWNAKNKNPRYDILGYDLTRFFIERLLNKELEEKEKTSLTPYSEGLQSEFNFMRESSSGGFINHRFYLGETQIR